MLALDGKTVGDSLLAAAVVERIAGNALMLGMVLNRWQP